MQFIKVIADDSIFYASKKTLEKSKVLEKAIRMSYQPHDRIWFDKDELVLYVDVNPTYFKKIISVLRGYETIVSPSSDPNYAKEYDYFIDNDSNTIHLNELISDIESSSEIDTESEEFSELIKQEIKEAGLGRNNDMEMEMDMEMEIDIEPTNMCNLDTSVLFSNDQKEIDNLLHTMQENLSSSSMPCFIANLSNDKNMMNLVKQHLMYDEDSDTSDQEDFPEL